ncbi:MAG: amidohydrolase [Bacteroidales bacterium]|jgi:predicted amidohydrolase YtcJ|nr:amidohydrolase [Bacteroidales bacterium]NLK80299.1 amidohydrolase [Bacteroidales bacterium]HPX79369.1 amidohydrolase [Bacteroidales bacterium]
MKKFIKMSLVLGALTLSVNSCSTRQKVDLVVYNACIYTVDTSFSIHEAFAVDKGVFLAVGSTQEIRDCYKGRKELNLQGAAVYPAFNDAHSHFTMFAHGLSHADLRGAQSEEEIIERLQKHYELYKPDFLEGDAWDQTLWENKAFPTNEALSKAFPDIPVYLYRVDFHAYWVNDKAIELAGVKPGDPSIKPGEALLHPDGTFTGIFLEDTGAAISATAPSPNNATLKKYMMEAQNICFAYGLGSITDGGLLLHEIELLDSLQKEGLLKIRTDVWLTPSEENFARFQEPYLSDRLDITTIKLYIDGALGSRGALMYKPYSDDPGNYGIQVTSDEDFLDVCRLAQERGFRVSTHAIGDKGIRKVLDFYAQFLTPGNDLRWRIEHAQVVAPEDFKRFGELNIVPSIQPTHATSDMGWAEQRVGPERVKGAYAFKDLIQAAGWAPFGTDTPVEVFNPAYTFFAAVSRTNLQMKPEGGWYPEQILSREETLKGMTIWAAMGSCREKEKGSIEPGKWADFVVWTDDLMTIPIEEIPETSCQMNFLGGEQVFP